MPFRLLSIQPFKTFYLTYQFFITFLIHVPLWILFSIPRSRRPRPSWDLKRVVYLNITRRLLDTLEITGPLISRPNHLAIAGGPGVNGVWVEPVPQLITGVLKTWMIAARVPPIRIPGYWMHKKGFSIKTEAPPVPGEKVVYHMHGGGYIRLSAHPDDPSAAIPRGFLKHIDSVHRTFSIEYRLSSTEPNPVVNPFPAALIDALAGYNYLVNVIGFSPSDIIFSGDSAGGNLANALARYLVEYQNDPDIPNPPSCMILESPWADLGVSHDTPGSSTYECVGSDYISPFGTTVYAKDAFVGPHGMGAAARNRYISPASLHPSMKVDFRGFPKTFLIAGGAEIFLDQIRTLRDRMLKDMGKETLEYHEARDAVHDYLCLSWHEPERTDTFKQIARWISLIS